MKLFASQHTDTVDVDGVSFQIRRLPGRHLRTARDIAGAERIRRVQSMGGEEGLNTIDMLMGRRQKELEEAAAKEPITFASLVRTYDVPTILKHGVVGYDGGQADPPEWTAITEEQIADLDETAEEPLFLGILRLSRVPTSSAESEEMKTDAKNE